MAESNFSTCLIYILKEEGGNDDDPHDPGGRTSRGIIQREYNAYRHLHGELLQDVWQASDAEVADIYQTQYWQPWCPQCALGVDLLFFDMAVNNGPHEAAILLQRGLGVSVDGHIGLITLAAAKTANAIRLIGAVSDARRAFYRSLKTFKYYGKGWFGRVDRIEQAAMKMAANATPAPLVPVGDADGGAGVSTHPAATLTQEQVA